MKVEFYPTTEYCKLKHGECFLYNNEAYVKLDDSYYDTKSEDYKFAHFIDCALRFSDCQLIEFLSTQEVQPIDLKVVKI